MFGIASALLLYVVARLLEFVMCCNVVARLFCVFFIIAVI